MNIPYGMYTSAEVMANQKDELQWHLFPEIWEQEANDEIFPHMGAWMAASVALWGLLMICATMYTNPFAIVLKPSSYLWLFTALRCW